jgi:hypothetical protein
MESEQLNLFGSEELDTLSWSRSPDSFSQIPLATFLKFLQSSPPCALFHGDIAFLMPNTSESPRCAVECSLSLILEENVPEKFYLSPKACAGVLRRAEARGKELPEQLKDAMQRVAQSGSTGIRAEVTCVRK